MNKLYDKEYPVKDNLGITPDYLRQGTGDLNHSAPKCTLRKCGVPTSLTICPFYDPVFYEEPTPDPEEPANEFKCPAGGIHDWGVLNADENRFYCTKCLDIVRKSNVV